jgi:hypothetical protein
MATRILFRAAYVLFAAVLLNGCTSQYFKDAGTPPPVPRYTLAHWPYHDYWTGIVFNGAKIGFSHFTLTAADATDQYEVRSEAAFVLHFLGLEKKFILKSRDRVNADLTLVDFDYDLNLDGNHQQLRGQVRSGTLGVTTSTRGRSDNKTFTLTAPLYPTSILYLYPLLHGLEVGREYRYSVFSGETGTIDAVEQKVDGYETSELFRGPAFKLSTRLHGQGTSAWIDAAGRPVFEMAMSGVLISALENEQTARRYLAQASLNKQEVLLDFSRVPVDRRIPAPRTCRTLELRFTGLDAAHLPPADAFQTCQPSGGTTHCRITAIQPEALHTPGQAVAPERALQPSIAVTSTDPRIRATAIQITTGATTDLEKINRLVPWMQANIRREPVDAFSALDVLDSKRAECQGHAYLYAAFARSLGIPTRVQNGLMYTEAPQGFLYHSWNESLVNGHWLPVDPTFGQVGADATHVKLVEGESPAELLPLLDVIGKIQIQVLNVE